MFSANLLYYVGGRCHELLPSSQSVDIRLLSSRGEGKCVLHVDVSQKETKDLLLYVPSYLRHESGIYNCRVCNVNVRSSGNGKDDTYEDHKTTEVLLRDREALKGKVTHKQRAFSKVKSHFKQLICSRNSTITTSSEDFIFSIQDIPSQSVLSIEVQFLLELKPSYYGSGIAVKCCWNKKTSYCYSLDCVSPYAIDTVEAIGDHKSFLKWHVYGSDRNFARLSFTSSSESVTQLEFKIISQLKSSPSLLVASSKDPLHQNGSSGTEHYVLLDLSFAPRLDARVAQTKFPSEFIFLVDCSGSMCGANIQSASDALVLFIKSLPVACYFNVIAFGSTFRNLFEVSQKYSKETVEKALLFADKLQASLGGTELLNPLHWVLKKPLIADMPRQVFILTDGAVTNTKAVLREIQKYSHQTRCHTFGIGTEACHELVLGVAALSNGRHVLVSNKDRLQEKVIDTLEESLKPALTDINIAWRPPPNYNVVETLCGHSGTVFSGGCATYWGKAIGSSHPLATDSEAFAVVTGTLGNVHKFEQVVRDVCDANISVPYSTVDKVVAWLKIQELERKLAISRRRSQDEQSLTEEDKTQSNYTSQQLSELSNQYHIPCSHNCLVGKDRSFLSLQQIIPEGVCNQTKPVVNSTKPVNHRRYHSRNGSSKYHHMSDRPSFLPPSNTLGTMVKGAVSSVSNSLKSLISVGLDSVFGPGCQDLVEDGQRIDDEIKLQNSSGVLRWGPEGELLHPSFYYQSDPSMQKSEDSVTCDVARKRKCNQIPLVVKSLKLDDTSANTTQLASMTISDDLCETTQGLITDCCQMDITRQPMIRPSTMMPLIHMQCYDGPWQLTELFTSAIGIPYRHIKEFIQTQSSHPGLSNGTSAVHCNENGYHSIEHESFWATVLAIVCLQLHFSDYQAEWKLLVEKATEWLEQVNNNLTINSTHAIENASNFTQQIRV